MSKLQTGQYPYICHYLDHILTNKSYQKNDLICGVPASTIFDITNDMQDWLSENVRRDGKNNYKWSETTFTIRLQDNYEWVRFSDTVSFTYETDLLAFRLRWGV